MLDGIAATRLTSARLAATSRPPAPARGGRSGRCRSGFDEPITHSWGCHVLRPVGSGAELLAEVAGVDAQVVRLVLVVSTPHLVQDRSVGQDAPGPPGEQ